jgi:hypothetical protein
MAKGVGTQNLSFEAREWLDTQMTRVQRHVIARAGLLAAQRNDDVVLPSHLETAYSEVLGRRSSKKQLGITITISAVMGGVVQGLFGGVGKSIGEYVFHLFR